MLVSLRGPKKRCDDKKRFLAVIRVFNLDKPPAGASAVCFRFVGQKEHQRRYLTSN